MKIGKFLLSWIVLPISLIISSFLLAKIIISPIIYLLSFILFNEEFANIIKNGYGFFIIWFFVFYVQYNILKNIE